MYDNQPEWIAYIDQRVSIRGNGCWLWAFDYRDAVPVIKTVARGRTRSYSVRRFLYYVEFSSPFEPPPDTEVLNTCGDSRCVAPQHSRLKRDEPVIESTGYVKRASIPRRR